MNEGGKERLVQHISKFDVHASHLQNVSIHLYVALHGTITLRLINTSHYCKV